MSKGRIFCLLALISQVITPFPVHLYGDEAGVCEPVLILAQVKVCEPLRSTIDQVWMFLLDDTYGSSPTHRGICANGLLVIHVVP